MKTTRRQMMMFAGGSAVGVMMTPAPWRLLTDTAMWSENWPGIPRPERGAISARYTNCPLCPAGCAVRARCIAEQPVSLVGVAGHPLSHGAMCAFGLAGHHLPYHPDRVKQGPVQEAAAAVAAGIARCGAAEHVAVLDTRPDRTVSWTYRRAMAALKNGAYLAPRDSMAGAAVDLSKVKTVLSFGAPVIDGWGTPGNVIAARPGFRLIQVEAAESRTASLADLWLRIRPGAEEALAKGMIEVLSGRSAAQAAEATGINEHLITEVAQELAGGGPALVLSSEASDAILRLNTMVTSLGHAIVARRDTPVPESWKKAAAVADIDSMADGSIRVLLIDESAAGTYLPWSTIEKKLVRDNPVVVALGWTREGYGRHAQYVLPTAVYPETVEDIPPAVDSVAATFRVTTALVPAPAGVVKPEEFIAGAAGLAVADTLRERADAIFGTKRGSIFTSADAKQVAVKDLKADEFWKALTAGGCWIDDTEPARAPLLEAATPAAETLPRSQDDLPLVVVMSAEMSATGSPILSKIYQESNLRLGPHRIALHPETARTSGVEEGGHAVIQTLTGRCPVDVVLDSAVPIGAVQMVAGPVLRDLCAPGAGAKVVRS